MSFFRPHKTKPRQFNYIPRYYDPVKEEREQRRRELHGPSSDDDEPYTPGRYIRTQREARDAAREESASRGFSSMIKYFVMAAVIVGATMILIPRFTRLVEYAMEYEETSGTQTPGVSIEFETITVGEAGQVGSIILDEQHGDIDFREFESLSPELLNEIDEWNRQNPTLTIYDDDVEIVDYKRVE